MECRAKPATETAVPARRSIGYPVAIVQREQRVNLTTSCLRRPLFGYVQHSQIKHLEQAVIRGENRLGFSHFLQLPIETLNGISRINEPPKFLRKLEICAEIYPVISRILKSWGIFCPRQQRNRPEQPAQTANSMILPSELLCPCTKHIYQSS
mgnify:FL=1